MGTCITRLAACALGLLSLSAAAFADDDRAIYDITHFDVLPVTPPPFDSEQIAYAALFGYRDASQGDFGNQSFRIVNWLEAPNHSFIVDVWKNRQAFEAHLAQQHSVAFRFGVQDVPTPSLSPPVPPGSYFECCIGSPIDDRQYTLVGQFGPMPWISTQLAPVVPKTPGTGAIFVIIYVDFLVDGDPNKGQDQLLSYGAVTANANKHLLNFTVLQQVHRPNRHVLLEVWDSEANYESWGLNPANGVIGNPVTANFVSGITPLLGSPLDYRLNSLCGETYKDGTGCVSP
jgi:quinol monooxygenase YgiN